MGALQAFVVIAVAVVLIVLVRRRATSTPGRLLYAEKQFEIDHPRPMVARVDQVLELPDGTLELVELKTRSTDRVHQSDIIELSAQRVVLAGATGRTVARHAVVLVETPAGRRSHKVTLLQSEEVLALADRREAILAGRIIPRYADAPGLCRSCPYLLECQPDKRPAGERCSAAP